MNLLIAFLAGLVVGGIGALLIWNNNRGKIEKLEQIVGELKK